MKGKQVCNNMGKSVAGHHAPKASRTHLERPQLPGLYSASAARKYINTGERKLIAAAANDFSSPRHLFALVLLWTGARISEVLALTPADFQIENAIISIRTLKRRRLSIREVPIPPWLMHALDRCFDISAAQQDPCRARKPLWKFSRTTGWRVIKALMAGSGIAGRPACPRGMRHGFGVGTLQAGVPITLVQRWLGHARLTTTAIYTEVSGPEETGFARKFWQSA